MVSFGHVLLFFFEHFYMAWKPGVTVAAVIERNNTFLMVEELIDGQRVINQPAGHLNDTRALWKLLSGKSGKKLPGPSSQTLSLEFIAGSIRKKNTLT